jgi:hypothetical protein
LVNHEKSVKTMTYCASPHKYLQGGDMIKNFFNYIWEWCVMLGTARAAAELSRMGYWQQANALYDQETR